MGGPGLLVVAHGDRAGLAHRFPVHGLVALAQEGIPGRRGLIPGLFGLDDPVPGAGAGRGTLPSSIQVTRLGVAGRLRSSRAQVPKTRACSSTEKKMELRRLPVSLYTRWPAELSFDVRKT